MWIGGFYRPHVLPATQPSVSKMRHSSTNPNQWSGLVLSSFRTRLLMERALLPLHQLSDARTFFGMPVVTEICPKLIVVAKLHVVV